MKSIEDLRSEIRAQALVLVGYSIAKDDAFLSDTAQILMELAAPSDDDAGELAEAYQNMRQYFADAGDGADSTETPDQPTQEPQEEDSGADAVVEAVNFAQNEPEPVTNTNGAEPETNSGGVIGSFSDVSDEAVREAGGEPVVNVGRLPTKEDIVDPDFTDGLSTEAYLEQLRRD